MQLRETRVLDESEIVGAQRSANFTISATSKAFQILMDGIYSNKVGASVREVMTNAWDAQVEAGTQDRPFQVHVPSRWESHFYVRDFGVSMTEEEVMGSEDGSKPGLYNSLFASTKTGSNDVAGAFGIGSKAPFAYIDVFQVTTWLDGVRTVYNCQMQTTGTPMVSKIGEVPSDEPRGVMVGFPVRGEDVDAFRKEIRRMLLGFDVMPELLNVDLDNDTYFGPAARIEPNRSGGSWRLYGREYNEAFGTSGLFARQGCVVYPIDLSAIEREAYAQEKNDALSLFRRSAWSPSDTTAILDFDIGDLSVAASRETLAYDEDTVKAIVGRLDVLADELIADAVTLIQAEPTPLRAAKAFDNLAVGSSLRTLVGKRVTVDVPVIDTQTNQRTMKPKPVVELVTWYKHGARMDAGRLERDYGIVISPIRHTAARPSFRPNFQAVVDVWDGCRFVLETPGLDRTTNRIVSYIGHVNDEKKQAWWVRAVDPATPEADLKKNLRSWLDSLDAELDFELLSDFDPADLSIGKDGSRGPYKAFRLVDAVRKTLEPTDHDPEDGGLYVLLKGGDIKWKDPNGAETMIGLYELDTIIRLVNRVSGSNPLAGREIIGIVGHSHGLVRKHAGWVDLRAELLRVVKDALDGGDLHRSARAWARNDEIQHPHARGGQRMRSLIVRLPEMADHVSDNHIVSRAAAAIEEERNDVPRFNESDVKNLKRWFDIEVPVYAPFTASHILLAQQIMEWYPLLHALDIYDADVGSLTQYINLVDEATQCAEVDAARGDAA